MSAKSEAKQSGHDPRPVSSKATFLLGGLALVVIAVVVAFGLTRSGESIPVRSDGYGTVRDPAVTVRVSEDGAILLGKPDARKTIDLFEDAICPGCGQLERVFGQEIAKVVDEGKIAVRYRLLDFQNAQSASGTYSTRAAAASQCVADAGDARAFSKFHAILFVEKQPTEGGRGDHSNQQLADFAKSAGAQDKAVQCIASGARVASAGEHAAAARKNLGEVLGGRVHTPAVLDGRHEIDTANSEWVVQQSG